MVSVDVQHHVDLLISGFSADLISLPAGVTPSRVIKKREDKIPNLKTAVRSERTRPQTAKQLSVTAHLFLLSQVLQPAQLRARDRAELLTAYCSVKPLHARTNHRGDTGPESTKPDRLLTPPPLQPVMVVKCCLMSSDVG